MMDFRINFLDHVAIKVRDIDISVNWYEKVLGLKKCFLPEWKNYPVFMLAEKSGIAIFPANTNDVESNNEIKQIRIDHFAFNVSNTDFEKAKLHYKNIGQEFKFQDHFYSHSIYTKDPDGHTVELTTIIDENSFYK
jgi:catechol 2,3-dioxygenase-like lactoylglutathione lyase family enzyme